MIEANRTAQRKPVIGFVLLSHLSSPALARLVGALNRTYDNPPIVIHHDFSQSPLPLTSAQVGNNISVVQPHYRTRWAHISLVDAFLTALEVIFEKHALDWFSLVSAACYPVARGEDVIDELANSPYDAYLDYKKIALVPTTSREKMVTLWRKLRGLPNLDSPQQWINRCYHRYISTSRSDSPPFSADFECFAGDQWFTANSKSAEVLIASRRERNALFYHYANVECPEESFYQTILCNHHGIRICRDNKRYADWSGGGAHPKELGEDDLPAILKSGCHFARKVSAEKSACLLDALDRMHFARSSS